MNCRGFNPSMLGELPLQPSGARRVNFSISVRLQKKKLRCWGICKTSRFPSHGTCQMHCEQLAYRAITVMGDCLLWFQRLCGLTNFAHALESQANNRRFFLVQLSDFGKEGRQKKRNMPLPGCEAMIYHCRFSLILISGQYHVQEWALASRVNGDLTSLLCSGGDKNSVLEVGSQEEPWL